MKKIKTIGWGFFRRAGLALAFCAVTSLSLAAAEKNDNDIMRRADPVDLDVWGGTINDALSQFFRQTGVMPLVSGKITRGGAARQKIYLVGKKLTFAQAVEGLAQAIGCRYRVNGDKIYLTAGYEWVTAAGRRYGVFIRNVETLVGISRPAEKVEKTARFQKFINELMKVVSLFEPDYRVRPLEEHNESEIKLNAQVPADLKPLFAQALTALESPGTVCKNPEALFIPPAERELIEKLSRTTVMASYRQQPLKHVIADLYAQSGINIGFDNSCIPPGGNPPLITLELGAANIQQVLTELARRLRLRGVAMAAPRAVWLGRFKKEWKNLPSRQILWVDNVEVRTYSIRPLQPQIDGEALAYWLRNHVFPDVWLDPLAAVVFHAPSNNILAIAPAPVQRALRNAIASADKISALRMQ